MRIRVHPIVAAVAAMLVQAHAAGAGAACQPSVLSLGRIDPGRIVNPIALALDADPAPVSVENAAVHYKPLENDPPPAESNWPIVTQVHGGYFEAQFDDTAPFILGVRSGPMVDRRLQVGIAADWLHQTKNLTNVLSSSVGPIGVPLEVKQDSARALLNQGTIMAFFQVSGWGYLGLVPFVGA